MNEETKKATNLCIAKNLVSNLESLLEGKAKYYHCSDLKTTHKKIVIEYDHETK